MKQAAAHPGTFRRSDPAHGAPIVPDEDRVALPPVLLQYWEIALRWKWVIAATIAICLIAGVAATLLTAPRYSAQTQIEISRAQKNITNVEGLETREDSRDQEFYATQYSLLKAQSLVQRVARRLKLAESDAFFKAHGVTMEPMAEGRGSAEGARQMARREREAARLLAQNAAIQPVRTSRLVDVIYTSRSPQLSALIANTWVQEFISATMDRQFASTADARRFLEERLAVLRERLEQSERDAVLYASNRDIVTLDSTRGDDGRTITEQTLASANLKALNDALLAARAARIAAESRAGGPADSAPEILSSPAIADMRARRAEASAELAGLLVRFEPNYPEVRAVRQRITALDAALAGETGRVARSRQASFGEALRQEQQLAARVAALKGELDRQRQDSIQYNIYQREADTNRQLYDALLQRYKEIGVAGNVGASNIVIVDPAEVPVKPSAPSLPVNLAFALLAGVILAAVVVAGLEQTDETFRNPAEVRKFLRMPVLGHVPLADGDPADALRDPKSPVSEAYFSIRSTLSFATDHGFPRSLVVTSTKPGEGKSTTALALAEIIGKTGKRVLLVDGDLRSPSLHNVLSVANDSGFANVLAGEVRAARLVRPTDRRGVSVLTSGPMPPNPAELLSGERLAGAIQELMEDFDHIVIDAPPVMGFADAPLMGRAVEGVVFILEAEKTPRRALAASVQRLQSVGDHLLGIVVTKVDASSHVYRYEYGYGSDHREAHAVRVGEAVPA